MAENTQESKLQRLEREREERRAALKAQWEEQRAIDLEALAKLEDEHGLNAIKPLDVLYTPGLPTLIACRTPEPKYYNRYRDRIKPRTNRDGKIEMGDLTAAAEELGAVTREYPDADTFKKMLDARPGILAQLGRAAADLASAAEDELAKS